MKGNMVLEYPTKMVLYLIVLMIVVSIIFYLAGNSKSLLSDVTLWLHRNKTHDETIKINVGTASWETLEKYSKMCNDKINREDLLNYKLCYVLTGNFSSVVVPESTDYIIECQDFLDATAVIISYNPSKGKVVIDC